MSNNIRERDLGQVIPATTDEVRLLRNGASVRGPISELPASASVQAQLDMLTMSQAAGQIGYATKSAMDADLAHSEGTLALVTNDPTIANNTTYRKVGASGAGSWVMSVDRISTVDTKVNTLSGEDRYGLIPFITYNSSNPTYFSALVGFTRAVVDGVIVFTPDGTSTALGYFARTFSGGEIIDPVAYPKVRYRMKRMSGGARRDYVLFVRDTTGATHYYSKSTDDPGALVDDGTWATYEVDIGKKPDGTSWLGANIDQIWVSLSQINDISAWALDYLVVGRQKNNAAMDAQFRAKPAPNVLGELRRALENPLRSVEVHLIGDSITWGVGATGSLTGVVNNGDLSDPRNILTNGTWANLLHRWMGECYADGVLIPSEGVATYTKTTFVPAVNGFNRPPEQLFTYRRPNDAVRVTPISNFNAAATTGYYVPLSAAGASTNYNAEVEFELTGDNLTVVYCPINSSDSAGSIVELWGNGVKLGEFNYYAAEQFKTEAALSFAWGRYRMRLVNKSASNVFRFEGVKHQRTVRLINDGLIGTSTGVWLPGSANLNGVLAKRSEFMLMQLGTNDRSSAGSWVSYFNLTRISAAIKADGNKLAVMASNACEPSKDWPTAPYTFPQRELAQVTRRVAREQGVPFVDNHQATVIEKVTATAWTADGLHPNDHGYRLMFENIRDAILQAP